MAQGSTAGSGDVYDASQTEADDGSIGAPEPYGLDEDDDLASRLNSMAVPEDDGEEEDDGGSQDTSEEDDGIGTNGNRGKRTRHTSEEPEAPPVEDRSFSRMVRNMAVKERELTTARQSITALEAEVRRLSDSVRQSQASTEHSDPIEVVRDMLARRIGVKDASDPRVRQALQELATDLTVESFDESALDDDLRQRRQSRQSRIREEESRRQLREEIDGIRRERDQARQQAIEADLINGTAEFVRGRSAELPFLVGAIEAGELDHRVLLQAARRGIQEGRWPDPTTREELEDVLDVVSTNLNEHYRSVADKLSTHLGKGRQQANGQMTRDGRQGRNDAGRDTPTRAGGRGDTSRASGGSRGQANRPPASPNRGGGGRGIPGPASEPVDDEDDSLANRFNRRMREQARANGRTGRK